MIAQPDYVKKLINDNDSAEHWEKVRYIYPLPAGLEQKSIVSKMFHTKEGYIAFEFRFDYIPDAPTDEDIINANPQSCSTCVNQGFHDCPYFRKNLKAAVCAEWEGYPVPNWGEVYYYADLHKAAYGDKLKAAE